MPRLRLGFQINLGYFVRNVRVASKSIWVLRPPTRFWHPNQFGYFVPKLGFSLQFLAFKLIWLLRPKSTFGVQLIWVLRPKVEFWPPI